MSSGSSLFPENVASLIDGELIKTGESGSRFNPSRSDQQLYSYNLASTHVIADAFAAAKSASLHWSTSKPNVRSALLLRVSNELDRRAEEIALVIAMEQGKLLGEARGEVMRAVATLRFYSQAPYQPDGYDLPSDTAGVGQIRVIRRPLGVVAVITPWNYPLAIPVWKIAPALAAGNTVVFKPATITAATAQILVKIFHDAGAPDGVVNLVVSSGSKFGEQLVRPDSAQALTFTGSTSVGQMLGASAMDAGISNIQTELGGYNASIVAESADINAAAKELVKSAFTMSGQRCTASRLIMAVDGVHDQLLERIVGEVESSHFGPVTDEASGMGPVANDQQVIDTDRHFQNAMMAGGELAVASTGAPGINLAMGHFLPARVVLNPVPSTIADRDEEFGPVLHIMRLSSFDDALQLLRTATFGLSAAVFTENRSEIEAFVEGAGTGLRYVNCSPGASQFHAPFSGHKHSGFGPAEQGHDATDFFSKEATVYFGEK